MRLKITKLISLSILILLLFGTGIVCGKYITQQTINANSEIARPVIEIEQGQNINVNDQNTTANYNFAVKNYDDKGNITDTDMNYTIEVINSGDSSITYNLYRENQEIPLNKNKTNKILIQKGKKEKHKYTLKVSYDKSKSKEFVDLTEDIGIKVYSEQKQ